MRKLQVLSFLLAVLLLTTVAAAQVELENSYASDVVFDYPAGWELQETGIATIGLTDNQGLEVAFYSPKQIASLIDQFSTTSFRFKVLEVLEAIDIEANALITFTLDGRRAARAPFESDEGVGLVVAVTFADDNIGVMVATASDAVDEATTETLLAIAASFDSGAASGSLLGALGTAASAGAGAVNCTVNTDQERFASVRVGPGNNRTAILFLPANRDFPVVGQGAANDGALWWKLNKEAVAPDSAAAELWVAQDQVSASGECERIADVAAPPIIPIVAAPPPAEEGAPLPEPGLVPISGIWSLNYGIAQVNCPDIGAITIDPEIPTQLINLSVQDGGASLVLGIDRFTLLGPGFYSGQITDVQDDGQPIAFNLTFQVIGDRRVEGSATFIVEDCTFLSPITLTVDG